MNNNFDKLKKEFGTKRSYRDRLEKLIQIRPDDFEGLFLYHLRKEFFLNKTKNLKTEYPKYIKIRRATVEDLAKFCDLSKKSIERGLTSFIKSAYNLVNSRDYSRDWMVFRPRSEVKIRSKMNNKNIVSEEKSEIKKGAPINNGLTHFNDNNYLFDNNLYQNKLNSEPSINLNKCNPIIQGSTINQEIDNRKRFLNLDNLSMNNNSHSVINNSYPNNYQQNNFLNPLLLSNLPINILNNNKKEEKNILHQNNTSEPNINQTQLLKKKKKMKIIHKTNNSLKWKNTQLNQPLNLIEGNKNNKEKYDLYNRNVQKKYISKNSENGQTTIFKQFNNDDYYEFFHQFLSQKEEDQLSNFQKSLTETLKKNSETGVEKEINNIKKNKAKINGTQLKNQKLNDINKKNPNKFGRQEKCIDPYLQKKIIQTDNHNLSTFGFQDDQSPIDLESENIELWCLDENNFFNNVENENFD
ncbi:hypothetical protein M0813_29375 [Anaeramoeba flamelloides]|uniref:Uncharacterized protein n=1 Tax=Anaeramoeba flamelloides TaxID=1746091 RepID=A0ABQ8XP58_9EUKA|nr:hypothetical protein M0813_29375 [Anaeramoeba flamelloides]